VLFSHLADTAHDIILLASNQPSDIDSLIEFYGNVAAKLPDSLWHPGNQKDVRPLREQTRPKQTHVLLAQGGDLLVEHLAHQLWNQLHGPTSRVYTPNADYDKNEYGKSYYRPAFVHSAVLARAFSLQPSFRDRLWRVLEEVLIKCLFSGTQQEPGNFVVTAVLIYGAGDAIRAWLSNNSGRGKDWYQWHDVLNKPDEVWGWSDIVAAFQDVDSLVEPEFEAAVPGPAMGLFKGLKDYVGDGKSEMRDWSAEQLASSYAWIDSLPEPAPKPERAAPSEYFEEITVLHPGDPGYDDEDDEDDEDEGTADKAAESSA
jgi:hypothetical protein